MGNPRIPNPVAAVIGDILGGFYYNHTRLNTLFAECGAPGEPPEGNCRTKCVAWLKRTSADPSVDALRVLGSVLEDFMEMDRSNYGLLTSGPTQEQERERIRKMLSRYGMSYEPGGRIRGGPASATPSRSLDALLRTRDLGGVEVEFERATNSVEMDPGAAVTAACAIVEAFCKVYIADESLETPKDQSIKPLWRTVQAHLGLDPGQLADDDLKRILSGLSSIVDGIGALRTHIGSAHGQGRRAYKIRPRHARLALHAAHSLVIFAIETWDARRENVRADDG